MKYMATKSSFAKRVTVKCTDVKGLLSPYLDGVVTGAEMLGLQAHLGECDACMREYKLLRQTQQLLMNVGRVKEPADLGLKLRLAISREAAELRRPRYEGLRMRAENALNAFMVPATAGLVCALLIFGLVTAILAMPVQVQANNEDVPLVLNTGPELQQSVFGTTLSSMNTDSLVIEAYVDRNGRVQDYRILSDPGESQELLPQVKRMLIFTTFRPAMSMGRPISSRAVLSFSRISVRG
ncbi:MAG: putative anti-sigma factor [Candidatus Sulfotelmatobacter sp.]|nr:putative anti-sigma factor [Candidatus Sulfotelmatobacter sp.]